MIVRNVLFGLLLCPATRAAQPQPKLEPGFHTGTITSVAMDSAERFLVTAADDRTVRVWDLESIRQPPIRLLRVLRLPDGGIDESRMYSAAISPDGSTIAAGGPQSRSIYIFDRASGRMLRRISGLRQVILQLSYSPDGRYLLAALREGGGIQLYRLPDYALAGEDTSYRSDTYWGAFSPVFAKDRLLATGAGDLYVRLYRVLPNGRLQLLRRRISEQKEPPISLAFSPDGLKLAVSFEYRNGYPVVEVWNSRTLARLYLALELNAMGGVAETIAWSADGKYLYLAGDLHAGGPNSLIVRVRTGAQGDDVQQVRACGEQTECSITGILPLRNGSLVFTSASQHGIGVLDAKWNVEGFQPAPLPAYGGLEDYDRFLLSRDGQSLRFAYQQDGIQPAWFSVPRRALVLGSSAPGFEGVPPDDKSLEVRGLGTDEVLLNGKMLPLDGETGLRVAVPAGGRQFVLATQWRLILFDREGKGQLWIPLPANPEAINVSSDGRFAVAALTDGTIRWYGLSDGQERLALFPHPDQKRWILWTPEGYYDASPGAEDLLGFQTNHGEDQTVEFEPAANLRSKYYRPEVIDKALHATAAAACTSTIPATDSQCVAPVLRSVGDAPHW